MVRVHACLQVKISKTIHWYNQNANLFASLISKYNDNDQVDAFSKLLPPGSKVLDAGCGTGRDTNYLKSLGHNPTGVDLSEGMLEVASKSYPDVEFVKGNLLHLPFGNNLFDGVWAHASLLHLKDDLAVLRSLKELHRVLKPGGILHLLLRGCLTIAESKQVFDANFDHQRWFRRYTKSQVQEMLAKANLQDIFTEQYNEAKRRPNGGRPDVEWIHSLSQKTK